MAEVISTGLVIIGAGFSGLGLAIQLKKAGINDFVLLEKAGDVGGTWRENTYPGAECDIASALYSYSFEHNVDWQYKWAEQPQILAYLQGAAKKYALLEHIRFDTEMSEAEYQETQQRWLVSSSDGRQWSSQYLVSAVGQLHHPFTPEYPGQEKFSGPQFHSARWDHSVELQGKNIAVIGNAASALQFIPPVAAKAAKMTVYQRSANWVIPKLDRQYMVWEKWLTAKLPLIARIYRFNLWLRNEVVLYPVMRGNRLACWAILWVHRRYINRHIKDPVLLDKLTPDYPIGAKRILVSDDYYAAMARDNVDLINEPIKGFSENAVIHADGSYHPVDVVIYGTGFKTNPFLSPMNIRGRDGLSLRAAWQEGAQAYFGMATKGFPNLFMMYGPNTNLGHNSIVIMSEAQSHYIVQCILKLKAEGKQALEVSAEAEVTFNLEIQQRLRKMAWNKIAVSWYKDGDKITNNWPGSTQEYLRRTRRVKWADYQIS